MEDHKEVFKDIPADPGSPYNFIGITPSENRLIEARVAINTAQHYKELATEQFNADMPYTWALEEYEHTMKRAAKWSKEEVDLYVSSKAL